MATMRVIGKEEHDDERGAANWRRLARIVRDAWQRLSPEAQAAFVMTPGFNPVVWKELTGIEVKVNAE